MRESPELKSPPVFLKQFKKNVKEHTDYEDDT